MYLVVSLYPRIDMADDRIYLGIRNLKFRHRMVKNDVPFDTPYKLSNFVLFCKILGGFWV